MWPVLRLARRFVECLLQALHGPPSPESPDVGDLLTDVGAIPGQRLHEPRGLYGDDPGGGPQRRVRDETNGQDRQDPVEPQPLEAPDDRCEHEADQDRQRDRDKQDLTKIQGGDDARGHHRHRRRSHRGTLHR
jgi:hypothetical protein